MSRLDVFENDCLRQLYTAVTDELSKIGPDLGDEVYVKQDSFTLFIEIPGGMLFRIHGTCSGPEDDLIPRLYGEIYGLLNLLGGQGSKDLASFLLKLLTVPARSFLNVSLGPHEELMIELYIPYTGIYARSLVKDAGEGKDAIHKYVKLSLHYFMAFLQWMILNLHRIANDEAPVDFDVDKLMKVFEDLMREEERKRTVPMLW